MEPQEEGNPSQLREGTQAAANEGATSAPSMTASDSQIDDTLRDLEQLNDADFGERSNWQPDSVDEPNPKRIRFGAPGKALGSATGLGTAAPLKNAMMSVPMDPSLRPTEPEKSDSDEETEDDEDEKDDPTFGAVPDAAGLDQVMAKYSGEKKGRKSKGMSAVDVENARAAEKARKVTVKVNKISILPKRFHKHPDVHDGCIEVPLAMCKPASELPVLRPPSEPLAERVRISERVPTKAAIRLQTDVFNNHGYDPNKGYFVGTATAFGDWIKPITDVDREAMCEPLRKDLEEWEALVVKRGVVDNDPFYQWIGAHILYHFLFLADGNTREEGWVAAIEKLVGIIKTVPRPRMVVFEIIEKNCRQIALLSEEINKSELDAKVVTTPLQKLALLHDKNRMETEEVKKWIPASSMALLKEKLNINLLRKKKADACRHNVLVFVFMEQPLLLKKLLDFQFGTDLKTGEDLGRFWTEKEKKTVIEIEQRKMRKQVSAAGFEKRDGVGFNYWEADIRKMVELPELSRDLTNLEILTTLKELNLAAFLDVTVLGHLKLRRADLQKKGLELTKDSLDPFFTSVKALQVAGELAVDWLEEQKLVEKRPGDRLPGQMGKWKGKTLAGLMANKMPLWDWIKTLIEGDYSSVFEHPFAWMGQKGLSFKSMLNKEMKDGGKAKCLEGMWRRLLVLYFRSCFPLQLSDLPTDIEDKSSLKTMAEWGYSGLPRVVKKHAMDWAGLEPAAGAELKWSADKQTYFAEWEIKALFEGERPGKKNWKDKEVTDGLGNGPLSLQATVVLGVGWENDSGGVLPKCIPAERTDPEIEPGFVQFVSLRNLAQRVGKPGPEVIGEEKEPAPNESGDEEEEVEKEEGEEEEAVENEVKELEGGSGVGFLKFFGPKGVTVVPKVKEILEALGYAKELGEKKEMAFDVEKTGVDMTVFFVRPRSKKVAEIDGSEKEIRWLPAEEFVSAVSERMEKVMAKGSVAVVVAPPALPEAWMVGLKKMHASTWGFRLVDKDGDPLWLHGHDGTYMEVSYWTPAEAHGEVKKTGGVLRTPEEMCSWPLFQRGGKLETYTLLSEHAYDLPREFWNDALDKTIDAAASSPSAIVFQEEYGGASEYLSRLGVDLLSVFFAGGKKGDFLERESNKITWDEEVEVEEGGVKVKMTMGYRDQEDESENESGEDKMEMDGEAKGLGKEAKVGDEKRVATELEEAPVKLSPMMTRSRKKVSK
ncbi:hypothetical protein KFL_000050260 [Klebsormidium nitens]|uniref:Uncharacterized protein n=1 Tax=Klebsormidium nitens TaxID=105231 RepID=A0A1Y1HL67_KLENI|nr:hypothetical protein KFL_000050260 [Klebsormidium nitens]|eukprot:GAQ77889.1 hypothetical protein KFL_000050260 [Klebsormidium nitens]